MFVSISRSAGRNSMNELSLFTGAGGGVLGSKMLGHRIIGYVENNDYRQRVIAQRIEDGIFDEAPIFGDIVAFNNSGYAESYQGLVDIVSGGFPCQDLSCAGKGAGLDGEKSGLWFEMATTVRIIRPRYVFIENVPALIVRGFDRVLGSLSQMGYSAACGIVSAADVGAPHLRKRLWILGHADKKRCKKQCKPKSDGTKQPCPQLSGCEMADTIGQRRNRWLHRPGWWQWEPLEALQNARKGGGEKAWLSIPESELGRVAYGTPDRSNRLAAIGDGQVPIVAAFAFEYLRAVIERQ